MDEDIKLKIVQNEIFQEFETNEQVQLNKEKIKLMLSKETRCLDVLKESKGDKNVVSIVGDQRQRQVGEVLRDLEFLSENIVKYLNLPKNVKKKLYKK